MAPRQRSRRPKGSIGPVGAQNAPDYVSPLGLYTSNAVELINPASDFYGPAGYNAAPGGAMVVDRINRNTMQFNAQTPTIAPYSNLQAYAAGTGTPGLAVTPSNGGSAVTAQRQTKPVPARKTTTGSTNGGKAIADGDLAKEAQEAQQAQQYAASQYQQGYASGQSYQASIDAAQSSLASSQGTSSGILPSFSGLKPSTKLIILFLAGVGGYVAYRRYQRGEPILMAPMPSGVPKERQTSEG